MAPEPTTAQLAALWPNPGPALSAETPARWPGSTPTSTAAARDYLQRDYEENHGYFNYGGAHNHTPFHILVEWSLGGNEDHLAAIYAQHEKQERPAFTSPVSITASNFSKYLGDDDYYQGYLYFFSELVLKKSANAVVEEWIFSSKVNFDSYNGVQCMMLNRLLAGILHPMIYLGYGLEFSLPGLIAEGLAQAATHKVVTPVLLPQSMFTSGKRSGTHAFSILSRVMRDSQFRGLTGSFGAVEASHGPAIHRYADEWSVDGSNPAEVAKKVRELCFMNVIIYAIGGWHEGEGFAVAEFTLMHLVTSSMTLSSYIATLASPMSKSVLLRAYFARALTYYIARGRPNLPVRSFYAAPILTDFPGPTPFASETAYPTAVTPNVWLQIIQSALVHPDDHLSKTQRTLAHYGSLYGSVTAGEFRGTELDGSELIDGTLFVRTASLTMQWMGRIREGEPANWWSNDPNFPGSQVMEQDHMH